jgi:hypothetical protein
MFVKVSPPSVDLYTPSPQLTLLRTHVSPVPTQMVSWSGWKNATSPIADVP